MVLLTLKLLLAAIFAAGVAVAQNCEVRYKPEGPRRVDGCTNISRMIVAGRLANSSLIRVSDTCSSTACKLSPSSVGHAVPVRAKRTTTRTMSAA
ncbi:uncharacterized protein B0T15DRAFT_281127 [Chaetomium strumarium]|uniref:Uncharacterized protein n=1 Tax=Chaetomium strumarium TaxID=1170767 RepID=A0AAJ0GPD8_9PEZI|nr:hypothetical protein B0T15DRAFT_281127 [Chaetomium strumarium]